MEYPSLIKDRVCFITGSTRGIGWEIAKMFAASGAKIILNGRNDATLLEERRRSLSAEFSVEVLALQGDVSEPATVKNFYRDIFKTFGALDVLVNNAGIMNNGILGLIPEESIAKDFSVNVFSVLYNLQAAARLMRQKKRGSIINMSSIIGTHGSVGQTVYSGTKAALIGITRSASKELAADQIRVNAIAPGFIDTDLNKVWSKEKLDSTTQAIGLKRMGKPEEVAQTALFLASDLSSYVTGQVIGVDGGLSL